MSDYSYKIDKNNVFTVFYLGEEVHTSRAFRLRVQAERKAKDWIKTADANEPIGDVTLDVQSVIKTVGVKFK